jgi:hypothetical protein
MAAAIHDSDPEMRESLEELFRRGNRSTWRWITVLHPSLGIHDQNQAEALACEWANEDIGQVEEQLMSVAESNQAR